MTIRGLSHVERRIRLAQALADLAAGAPIETVAANYNYSVASLRVMRSKSRMDKHRVARKRLPPEPQKPSRHDLIAARDAKVVELHDLCLTRHQIAARLGVSPATIYLCVKRLGLVFAHAGAELPQHAKNRAAPMVALYREGYTLKEVGDQYGITRERVRQLMTKYYGMNWKKGGAHAKAERTSTEKRIARSDRYQTKYGCTVEQWQAVREIGQAMHRAGRGLYQTPLRAFCNQRNNAKRRGIGWELNFWQWWTIWQESGHWEQRGLRAGQYVMCRKGDVGPYALGNVFVALSTENVSTGNRKKNSGLPIGVRPTKSGKYVAHRHVNGKTLRLGTFSTAELAYAAYLMATPVEARAA